MSASTKWGKMLQEKYDEAAAVHGEHGWWVPDADSAHPTGQDRRSRRVAALGKASRVSDSRRAGNLAAAAGWSMYGSEPRYSRWWSSASLYLRSPTGRPRGRRSTSISRMAASVGRLVATVMLAIVYFVVITPVSLYLRLTGRNPLNSPGLSPESTWITKPRPSDPAMARHQFSVEPEVLVLKTKRTGRHSKTPCGADASCRGSAGGLGPLDRDCIPAVGPPRRGSVGGNEGTWKEISHRTN